MYSNHNEAISKFISILNAMTLKEAVHAISAPWDTTTQYNTEWPNNTLAGVYLFLDDTFHLLYIGKSSFLGSRLQKYFRRSPDNPRKGIPKKPESKGTRYIVTIGLNPEYAWLAPSLEEFMIAKLRPKRNRIGNF